MEFKSCLWFSFLFRRKIETETEVNAGKSSTKPKVPFMQQCLVNRGRRGQQFYGHSVINRFILIRDTLIQSLTKRPKTKIETKMTMAYQIAKNQIDLDRVVTIVITILLLCHRKVSIKKLVGVE